MAPSLGYFAGNRSSDSKPSATPKGTSLAYTQSVHRQAFEKNLLCRLIKNVKMQGTRYSCLRQASPRVIPADCCGAQWLALFNRLCRPA
jgi:hypothetical protein